MPLAIKKALRYIYFLLATAITLTLAINLYVVVAGGGYGTRKASNNNPLPKVAIVLGAQVLTNGIPSKTLSDRLEAGASLVLRDQAQIVMVSGRNQPDADHPAGETNAMRGYLLGRGVPAERIACDYNGNTTRATMQEAAKTFGLKEAVVVTQRFHMPRAIYLAKRAGIKATPVTSDKQNYGFKSVKSQAREIPARIKAFRDSVLHRSVTYGNSDWLQDPASTCIEGKGQTFTLPPPWMYSRVQLMQPGLVPDLSEP